MLQQCLCNLAHHRAYQRLVSAVVVFLLFVFILLNLPARSGKLLHTESDAQMMAAAIGQVDEFVPMEVEVKMSAQKDAEQGKVAAPDNANGLLDIGENSLPSQRHLTLVNLGLTMHSKCPACLGTELCEDIQDGHLRINKDEDLSVDSHVTIHQGLYQTSTPVWIKSFVRGDRFVSFEENVCLNRTGKAQCDVKKVIKDSFVAQAATFKPDRIKQQYVVAHNDPSGVRSVACATNSLMEQFQDATFDPGDVSLAARAMFYVALTVYPEINNLRFLTNTKSESYFVDLVGVCGRIAVFSNPGTPLTYVIKTGDWHQRAGIALQLFYMIDSFMKEDDSVFMIYSGFNTSNIYINNEGRVVLVDAHYLSFIDKESIGIEYEIPEGDLCNSDCLDKFQNELYSASPSPLQDAACRRASTMTMNIMFAQLCQHVLSDLPQHTHQPLHSGKATGLMHSPPIEQSSNIQSALKECVEETVWSGRIAAAEELKEILSMYANEHGPNADV